MIASRTEAEEIRERGWANVAIEQYKIELREQIRREMFPHHPSTHPQERCAICHVPLRGDDIICSLDYRWVHQRCITDGKLHLSVVASVVLPFPYV